MSLNYLVSFGAFLALSFSSGCFHLPKIEYSSDLIPKEKKSEVYSAGDEGVVSYYGLEGLRIDVQYLDDKTLNQMFPDDSKGGKISTNPYTYGDWVDPNLGYTPNRFTVFRVSVFNYTYPKMLLDPLQAILLTDRGELLESYTVSPRAQRKSLEGYYRALRGISGNEHHRFSKRIGIVRGTIYGEDELIFKGESYSGLLVFESLHPEVGNVRLIFKNVAYKFDTAGKPIATVDIPFDFRRTITHQLVEKAEEEEQALETVRVVIQGPLQLKGNQPGDVARNAAALNSVVSQNIRDLNRCFRAQFDKGEAIAGEVVVRFIIRVNGLVEGVGVAKSTVTSKAVEECIVDEVARWRFSPAGQFIEEVGARETLGLPGEEERGAGPAARPRTRPPLTDVDVVYPFIFESIEE